MPEEIEKTAEAVVGQSVGGDPVTHGLRLMVERYERPAGQNGSAQGRVQDDARGVDDLAKVRSGGISGKPGRLGRDGSPECGFVGDRGRTFRQ